MKILDCETVDSICQSMRQIFGINRNELNKLLSQVEEDELYVGDKNPDEVLIDKLQRETNTVCEIEAICWFHMTRTRENNSFEQGLLPLGEALDGIWDFLFSLVKDNTSSTEWNIFRTEVEAGRLNHSARLYKMKTNDHRQWGPNGILIRDFAFIANLVKNHDYLRTPEIVEDIAICFNEVYDIDLQALFTKATYPCIIKFIDDDIRLKTVGTALHYLYALNHNSELRIMHNTTIDKYGKPIPRENILNIEFPQYP